ncbi:Carboxy-terminal processing protease CtpB [Candidatus Ornithobacterium hominis]|uniref:S41 family peptidase n=1 Tax=Candidatus Ornithobacterium hominis TaxID=2497989 RepID=UPI0024BC6A26|nr:S41 family peptidase [Candidatus Ornithobacterium hominis]CAI9428916.1 Carboxy-terminal processing protease CtpB [Candidatus Ornithobacterium hominis]
MKGFKILNFLLIILAVILLILLGYHLGKNYDIAIDENDDYITISYSINEQKMRRLMSLIEHQYVDDLDTDSLVDRTIDFIMENLDPHSMYIPKHNSAGNLQSLNGRYQGIGVEFYSPKDTAVIIRILSNSPNKDKLFFGDRLLAINQKNVIEQNVDSIPAYIESNPEKNIELKILRGGEILKVNVDRGTISSPSVVDFYMIDDRVGYIKLIRFVDSSYDEFHQAILALKKQGMKSLIFDLRGNAGGLMSVAEKITDEFLREDQLIVFTQDKSGKRSYRYATAKGDFEQMPLYILVDESSASASEIVAGAIQDQDAGTIIGRRTYGKGLVQKEISLGDGSKVRLTTAHYFTPTGRSIQKPYAINSEEYKKDLSNRFMRGEFFSLDSIKKIDSLKFKTPKGKIVYGGGGIIPDVFIPLDTLRLKYLVYTQEFEQALSHFIFKNLDENLSKFKKIKKEHFVIFYNADDLALKFIQESNTVKHPFEPKDKDYLATYIKARMAEMLYDQETFYRVWRHQDEIINKAYEIAHGME